MLSQYQVRTLFDYDADTGSLINKTNRSKGGKPGTKVGNSDGRYLRTVISGRRYSLHRLIWIFHFGDIHEGFEIDHIDRDKTNNRIENLRIVTHSQNLYNRKIFSHNRHGSTGVTFRERKWEAFICVGYKTIHLGRFSTKRQAIQARKNAERRYVVPITTKKKRA